MSRFTTDTGGDLLMVFAKNPEYGKVKTRLAKTIGHKKALEVYQKLLEHTRDICLQVGCFRIVYYSDFIDFDDLFDNQYFLKDEQVKGDLGERMAMAFGESFKEGYQRIVCIGSDCYELSSDLIKKAFVALDDNDVVIGPAKDGGYYLIGMKDNYEHLFMNKEWSTNNLLLDTLIDLKSAELKYHLLPTLSDVDQEEDLVGALKSII
ncbi:TIGR04282 family arsenosugar biosynthesis glycosyltransferase [bacterium SCSIO 12741]|nr:TIGR04282 family arsenosugar biosynthesis glycosyltransferase [bacterium SCSIO 12741]